MEELLINGNDALATWGVKMGNGFIEALTAPCSMKDYIENTSRKEHGKTVLLTDSEGNNLARIDSREITLTFVIIADTHDDYVSNKKSFFAELYKGKITIEVPEDSNEVYRLVYKGKYSSFGHNITRTMCSFAVKFEEPNPNDREK